jgi:hypothetical protein
MVKHYTTASHHLGIAFVADDVVHSLANRTISRMRAEVIRFMCSAGSAVAKPHVGSGPCRGREPIAGDEADDPMAVAAPCLCKRR